MKNNLLEKIKNKYSYLTKPFLIILAIFLFAIYPIIRANFNYIDDLGRVDSGYRGWADFSRFVSEYLSVAIHTSDYLTDISPLPQILAVVIIAISCTIVLKLFSDEKISFSKIIAVIPIGLSPYFLECLSYKYDSVYMALSVLACILPFIFYGKTRKNKWIFSIAIIIGTLVMSMSYQASSGIIPLMALFLAFKYWNNKESKDATNILILSAISYIIGLLFFRIFIMKPIDTYVSSAIVSLNNLIPTFFSNLAIFYQNLLSDFRTIWKVLTALIVIFFIINNIRGTKQNKILSFVFSIVLLILSCCLAFGVYPALEKLIFYPRTMYGIGVLISLIAINGINIKKTFIPKVCICILCYSFITFCFTYGNVLSEHKRYVDFRTESVINELSKVEIMKNNDTKYIYLKGTIGYSPSMENMPDDYKNILSRLIQQSFSGKLYMWDVYYFKEYFKINNIKIANPETSVVPKNLETVCDTMYFSIETNNTDFILINLK